MKSSENSIQTLNKKGMKVMMKKRTKKTKSRRKRKRLIKKRKIKVMMTNTILKATEQHSQRNQSNIRFMTA